MDGGLGVNLPAYRLISAFKLPYNQIDWLLLPTKYLEKKKPKLGPRENQIGLVNATMCHICKKINLLARINYSFIYFKRICFLWSSD